MSESTGYVPTPDMIREECARIQSKWSPSERRKRRATKVISQKTGIKVVDTDGIGLSVISGEEARNEMAGWQYRTPQEERYAKELHERYVGKHTSSEECVEEDEELEFEYEQVMFGVNVLTNN